MAHSCALGSIIESTARVSTIPRKIKMKKIDRMQVTKQLKAKAFDAYLYLITCHKKNEANLRKGRQRSTRYNYQRMKRGHALMQMISLHTKPGTKITRESIAQSIRDLMPQLIAEYPTHTAATRNTQVHTVVAHPTVCMSAP